MGYSTLIGEGSVVIKYKDYEIRPYKNNLCWEIYKFRMVTSSKDNSKHGEYISLGKYPTDLGQALETLYEFELKKDRVCYDLKFAMDEAKKMKKEIMDIGIYAEEAIGK